MTREKCLEEFKQEYQALEKKYKLPDFKSLNDNFEIEKIADRETEFVLRNVRRELMERVTTYMRFLETLMNPSQAPYLFMALSGSVSEIEKKIINDMYFKLGKYFMKSIELDNQGEEKDEAEFIKEIFSSWKEIKKEFSILLEVFGKSWEKKKENKDKNYIS